MALADEPAFSAPLSGTMRDAEQLSTILDDLEARSRSFGSALTGALKGAVVDGRGLESVLRGLALRISDIALSAGLKPLQNLVTSGMSSLLGGILPAASAGAAASGPGLIRNVAASGNPGLVDGGLSSVGGGTAAAALTPLQGLATSGMSGVLADILPFADRGGRTGRRMPAGGLTTSAVGQLFDGLTPFARDGVVASPRYFSGEGGGLLGEAGTQTVPPLRRGADGAPGAAVDGGNAPRIVFNVTAQDAASFRKSEGQIAAMLTRAVGRGQRSL